MDIILKSGSALTVKDENGNDIVKVKEDGTVEGAGTKLYKHRIDTSNGDSIILITTSSSRLQNSTDFIAAFKKMYYCRVINADTVSTDIALDITDNAGVLKFTCLGLNGSYTASELHSINLNFNQIDDYTIEML